MHYPRQRPLALLVPLALAVLGAAASSGCSASTGRSGPRALMISRAASNAGVPADLMLAVANVEGGLALADVRKTRVDDAVPVAGVLELRHGSYNSLARGAELLQVPETDLEANLETGTKAGAMVLDDLAKAHSIDRKRLEAWAPVIEELSGLRETSQRVEYRARVFRLLRSGGTLKARNGETIELDPHEDIPADLTFAPPRFEPLGTPDYAGATWVQTSCTNKCDTTRNATISMVAIHDTEGGWDASVATLQNDSGKSVHYIVDHDGSRVAQFVPESYNAWHVGNSYYNNRMVGIEHVGVASQDDYLTPMYQASAALVKDIVKRNGIKLDRSHIVAHQEVPDGSNEPQSAPPCADSPGNCIASGHYGGANHHDDPGVFWEWCQYMELVGDDAPGTGCKCNDTFDHFNCVHDLSMMNRCKNGQVEIVHCATPCMVEPNGVDDQCTPDPSTSSATTGTGGDASASATSTGTGAPPGSGGMGGAGGGVGDGSLNRNCSCRVAESDDEGSSGVNGVALFSLLCAVVAWRRPRRLHP